MLLDLHDGVDEIEPLKAVDELELLKGVDELDLHDGVVELELEVLLAGEGEKQKVDGVGESLAGNFSLGVSMAPTSSAGAPSRSSPSNEVALGSSAISRWDPSKTCKTILKGTMACWSSSMQNPTSVNIKEDFLPEFVASTVHVQKKGQSVKSWIS